MEGTRSRGGIRLCRERPQNPLAVREGGAISIMAVSAASEGLSFVIGGTREGGRCGSHLLRVFQPGCVIGPMWNLLYFVIYDREVRNGQRRPSANCPPDRPRDHDGSWTDPG